MKGPVGRPDPFFCAFRLDEHQLAATVTVVGEIDICTVGHFQTVMTAAVATDLPSVIVDVDGVTYAGVAMIDVLEQAAQQLAGRGGHLVVRNAQPAVLRLVKVAGLNRTVEIRQKTASSTVDGGHRRKRWHACRR